MYSALTEKLQLEVREVKSVLAKHDQIRNIIYAAAVFPAAPVGGAVDPLTQIQLDPPALVEWRIYDHSASLTRLYALYERFVTDIVDKWLDVLPELCPQYLALPEKVQTGHRVGVAEILLKLTGDQYQHLSQEKVLRGLFEGTTGLHPYSFLHDAFLTDNRNLWPSVLAGLFTKVGITDSWQWVNNHTKVARFIQEVRGNASSAESELRNFIQYRNRAAHGDVDDVLAIDEIDKIADFLVAVCEALSELVMCSVIRHRQEAGRAEPIGEIIAEFGGQIVGVETAPVALAVGETLIVLRENACYFAVVHSMEENHVAFQAMQTVQGQKVALRLSRDAKVGGRLLRLLPSHNIDFFQGDGI